MVYQASLRHVLSRSSSSIIATTVQRPLRDLPTVNSKGSIKESYDGAKSSKSVSTEQTTRRGVSDIIPKTGDADQKTGASVKNPITLKHIMSLEPLKNLAGRDPPCPDSKDCGKVHGGRSITAALLEKPPSLASVWPHLW